MTLFELVKQNICVPDAAKHYGLQVNRNGMCSCPFHEDQHPSMKLNERYFYCFGCGATGDVIDFVARLFGLNSYEAAQKLSQDFGIDPDKHPAAIALPKPKRPLLKAYRREEVRCLRVLCDYLHLLESWKQNYAPSPPDETGVPNGTQQRGSVGERTSSGMSDFSLQSGKERYVACEDEKAAREWKTKREISK